MKGNNAWTKDELRFMEIDGIRYPIYVGFYGDDYIRYQHRSRLIKKDGVGTTYIETSSATIFAEVKNVSY